MTTIRELLEGPGSAWLPKKGAPIPKPFWKDQPRSWSKKKKSQAEPKGAAKGAASMGYKQPASLQLMPEDRKFSKEFAKLGGTVSTHKSKFSVLVVEFPAGIQDRLPVRGAVRAVCSITS